MKYLVLSTAFVIVFSNNTLSQVSLASENIAQGIVVSSPFGESVSYTLMRDHYDKDQWYYEPVKIRLAETLIPGNKPEPKISFVSYSYLDKKRNKIKNAGVILATFTFAAYPSEEEQLRNKIIERTGNPNARVACMRYKKSTYSIAPMNVEFFEENYEFSQNQGAISGGEMAVVIPVTEIGSSVLSKSGFALQSTLVFNGLTPPCGVNVNGSWDNVFSYQQTQKNVGGALKLFGIKLGGTYDKGTIREAIAKDMNIKIDVTDCEGGNGIEENIFEQIVKNIQKAVFTDSEIGQANKIKELQEILDKKDPDMSKEVVEKIKSAIRDQETSLRASYSRRDLTQKNKGKISFSYSKNIAIERTTSISGLLSLKPYAFNASEMKKYEIKVNLDEGYPEAIFGLPKFFSEAAGVQELIISITSPITGTTRTATYTPQDGWHNNESGEKISALLFPLLSNYSIDDIKKMDFNVDLLAKTAASNNTIMIKNFKIKAFDGENYFDAIDQLISTIEVNPELLSFFRSTQQPGDIEYVKIRIHSNNKTYSHDFTAINNNGSFQSPNRKIFLIEKEQGNKASDTRVEIFFKCQGKRDLIPWAGNGILSDFNITLTDSDWQQ
jgi:hypothetical protein